jgi:hypothetical protein
MFPIILLTTPIQKGDLEIYKSNPYDSMIKYVVDINKSLIAIGGEMHSDAEKVLLENGSIQENIWGSNLYPWGDIIEIEYTSLINIRPTSGNRSMEIQEESIREKVKKITFEWIQIL